MKLRLRQAVTMFVVALVVSLAMQRLLEQLGLHSGGVWLAVTTAGVLASLALAGMFSRR